MRTDGFATTMRMALWTERDLEAAGANGGELRVLMQWRHANKAAGSFAKFQGFGFSP